MNRLLFQKKPPVGALPENIPASNADAPIDGGEPMLAQCPECGCEFDPMAPPVSEGPPMSPQVAGGGLSEIAGGMPST